MKVAFAVWNGRIAPVFDVSRQVIVVEIAAGREISRCQATFASDDARHKLDSLTRWGVQTLVCGALSHSYGATLATGAIKTVAFVAGEIEEVIAAFITGNLDKRTYRMPGCACAGRNRCGAKGRG